MPGHHEESVTGIHHKHRDYYSENSPIPSIQRFFKKGLSEVVARRSLADSDSDSGEEDADRVQGSGGEPTELFNQRHTTGKQKAAQEDGKSTKERLAKLIPGSKSRHESQDGHVHPAGTDEEDRPSGQEAHQNASEADKAYKRSRAPRKVRDPITGRDTWVHDVGKREYRHTLARAEAGDKRGSEEVLRDNFANNLTSRTFPPPDHLPSTAMHIDRRLLPLFLVWSLITAFRLIPAWISVILNAWLVWWGWRALLSRSEDQRWNRERQRGEQLRSFDELEEEERAKGAQQGIAEGAEWLNGILEALWSVMNPELFSSLGGTLEDVMQASIPGFIHSVKVEDLAQGSTPVRITGLKILPDDHVQSLVQKMREERKKRTAGEARPISEEERKSQTSESSSQDCTEQQMQEEDKAEHYVNLELGFVYRARPTSNGVGGKSRNAHLLIKFWIGARKLLMIPLPVWVEVKGFVGKVRARVQLTSDPPFIKDVTITFCGLPRVGIEVVPLRINTSNIPFISSFIESSIDAAIGEFVMPSSLSLDVGEMLMGDNIKREVLALGVVVVLIHSATDLEKQDIRGSSDPYCTLSLSKVGKILYSTRVVVNDLSPRWEERHVILVTRENLDSDDKVSIALWDSDRFSQDDMLGQAEVDLVKLARHPNKMFKRSDTLKGLDREKTKQGIIHWSLGYFSKTPSMRRGSQAKEESASKRGLSAQSSTTGSTTEDVEDDAAPGDQGESSDSDDKTLNDGHKLEEDSIDPKSPLQQEVIDREKKTQTRNQTTAVDSEPPDPTLPSGILSMQIHHIANLEVSDKHKSLRTRHKNEPGQDVESIESEDDPSDAPSAYCRIILNDEIIFQTRTKALNSNPFYNAGTERFIRDWRRTLIMVVVYDFRVREADAILGVVPIKLKDLFRSESQVTQFFPIAGGVGHGRIRLSLLFRPVECTNVGKNLLGWNIGTVRLLSSPVASDFVKGANGHDLHLVSLRAATLAGKAKIAASRARYVDSDKSAVEWSLKDVEFPFKVPARRRYSAPYTIEFRTLRRTTHLCILWQQDLPDDEILDLQLPIYRPLRGHDFHRLRQNYHDYRNESEAEQFGVEKVGYLKVKMQFKSGLGKVHTQFEGNEGARLVMDAWRACTRLGLRSVSGDFANARVNTSGFLEDPDDDRDDEPGEAVGSDSDSEADNDEHDRSQSKLSDSAHDQAQHTAHDTDSDTDSGQGLQRSRSMKEKFTDWRAEKSELHRQHKGITAHKPVRTLEWLGQSAKTAGSGLKDKFDLQDRRSQRIETEL